MMGGGGKPPDLQVPFRPLPPELVPEGGAVLDPEHRGAHRPRKGMGHFGGGGGRRRRRHQEQWRAGAVTERGSR